MDLKALFAGKKITVMGLGLLGRGIGDARFLAECGAELIVTDLKDADLLADSVAQLNGFPGITFVLGEHRLEDFRNRDFILKAAGVPIDSPYVLEARRNGIPIKMSASWFIELSGSKAIGVTGTRGKSTTTHMIEEILKVAERKHILGGNIRGVSTLAQLASATKDDLLLLELDSWQLQGFGESKLSPEIAVFTTFYPDHLNYYGGDLAAYLSDKANIFLFQDEDEYVLIGAQAAPFIQERYAHAISSKISITDEHMLPEDWILMIPGVHNRYNAALALGVARILGISDTVSRKALEQFTGVPGRLELLGMAHERFVYDDSTSTTPDATLAALDALHDRPLLLIMGGADKNLDMSSLLEVLPKKTREVLLLAGSGTERIKEQLPASPVFNSLADAVAEAFSRSLPGDAILFSPAFASFGMFRNEYERSDVFRETISTYAAG